MRFLQVLGYDVMNWHLPVNKHSQQMQAYQRSQLRKERFATKWEVAISPPSFAIYNIVSCSGKWMNEWQWCQNWIVKTYTTLRSANYLSFITKSRTPFRLTVDFDVAHQPLYRSFHSENNCCAMHIWLESQRVYFFVAEAMSTRPRADKSFAEIQTIAKMLYFCQCSDIPLYKISRFCFLKIH